MKSKIFLKGMGVSFGISDIAIRTALSGQRGKPHQVAWEFLPIPIHVRMKNTRLDRDWYLSLVDLKGKPPETLNVGPNFRHEGPR